MKRIAFHAGPVDGLLGTQTRGALAAFESDNGFGVTSAVDRPTCRRSVCRNIKTLRDWQTRPAMRCAALVFLADDFAASPAVECPFVFEADMHPEKDATTLNKCKPQKV